MVHQTEVNVSVEASDKAVRSVLKDKHMMDPGALCTGAALHEMGGDKTTPVY